MIPLKDDQPTSTFPIITILLIVANIVVFVIQQITPGFTEHFSMVPQEVYTQHSLAGAYLIPSPDGPPSQIVIYPPPNPVWITIFSAMFLHASYLHIGGNMLYLWIFGNNIEDVLGKLKFVFFYLTCGLIAAAAQIFASPLSIIPTLGASGAIAGVLGAYILLFPNARVFSIVPIFGFGFFTDVRAFWVLAVWFGLQLVEGFHGVGAQQHGGVAYFAHIGGFVAGLILISLFGGAKLVDRQRRKLYRPPNGRNW